MQVNPGKLNKRISFMEITSTKNANGFKTPITTEKHSCYAQVTNDSGKKALEKSLESGATFSNAHKRFLVRYSPNIKEEYVVRYNDKNYKIEYVNNYNDENKWMEVFTTKKELIDGEF